MKHFHIGDGFNLPVDAVTQTFAILAKRGVGKTYSASVMAEEMLAGGHQIIALDPTGAWWGLRSGYPVVVLGGEHGDLPLEESAGEMVATAIVTNRFSAVLDLSLFRKGAARRFVTAFLETLYRLNRDAVHLFVDEADDIAPQKPFGDEAAMVGALEDVVKRGRRKGIGCTLITQRPADLAKQVLTQCEVLVSLRIVHPRDIAAIKEWVAVHGDPDTAKTMIGSLPSLPVGEAWFWAPGWGDLFERVKIRKRHTHDSGATPKPGEKPKAPPKLAAVDLAKLGDQIRSAVETAKANDPKELKAEIARLKKELAARPETKPERVEVPVPVLSAVEAATLRELQQLMAALNGRLVYDLPIIEKLKNAPRSMPQPEAPKSNTPENRPMGERPKPELHGAIARNGTEALPKAHRLILTALIQHGPSTKSKCALVSGYAVGGGGFNNAVSSLRTAGHVVGRGDLLEATAEGAAALGPVHPLPTGAELIEQWRRELPKAEGLILGVLADRYPAEVSKEDLAAAAGYEPSGGGFNNALSRLRTLELIEGRGALRASPSLF